MERLYTNIFHFMCRGMSPVSESAQEHSADADSQHRAAIGHDSKAKQQPQDEASSSDQCRFVAFAPSYSISMKRLRHEASSDEPLSPAIVSNTLMCKSGFRLHPEHC